MKLIGNLKKQVEETKNKEEAKEVIEKAGMELTDEELDQVAGGEIRLFINPKCDLCGSNNTFVNIDGKTRLVCSNQNCPNSK